MTTSRASHTRHSTQFLGLVGLVLLAVLAGLLIATYRQVFKSVVHVTVQSDRAGLLLDKGSRVRLSGVPVGEVRRTTLLDDGTVAIDVALDTEMAGRVPASVTASIRGTTVFGAKFVDLRIPQEPVSEGAIKAGASIPSSGVTVEANDVFQHAIGVVGAVEPAQLNKTLTAMSTALQGRGDKLGQVFTDWDSYLKQLEPHLPALEADLRAAAGVVDTYADVAPDLIQTASNLGTTSQTLVSKSQEFEALLTGVVTASGTLERFLTVLENPLVAFNREWLPVTALGGEYSPEFGCIIDELHEHVQVFNKVIAYGDNSADIALGFLPAMKPYSFADNRPKLVSGIGPTCYATATKARPSIPHIDFDDGTAGVYSSKNTGLPADITDNPVGLYLETVRSFFGESGLQVLLDDLKKEPKP